MGSSRPEPATRRALDRKADLLDLLGDTYENAVHALVTDDLSRLTKLIDSADSLIEELETAQRALERSGVETPEEIRRKTEHVRLLHARLSQDVALEHGKVGDQRQHARRSRRALRGYSRGAMRSGLRLDGEA